MKFHIFRDVLDKEDEEKMPDYANSKNFKLLPHFLEYQDSKTQQQQILNSSNGTLGVLE